MNLTNADAFIKYDGVDNEAPQIIFMSTSTSVKVNRLDDGPIPIVRVVIPGGGEVELTRGDVYELEEFLSNWRTETSL